MYVCMYVYTIYMYICLYFFLAALRDKFVRSDCLLFLLMPTGTGYVNRDSTERQARKRPGGQREREWERGTRRGREKEAGDENVSRRWRILLTKWPQNALRSTEKEPANPCNILSFYGNWTTWKDFQERSRGNKTEGGRGVSCVLPWSLLWPTRFQFKDGN